MNILCGRLSYLTSEDMTKMGGIGKAVLPCRLEDGGVRKFRQQAFGLVDADIEDEV